MEGIEEEFFFLWRNDVGESEENNSAIRHEGNGLFQGIFRKNIFLGIGGIKKNKVSA